MLVQLFVSNVCCDRNKVQLNSVPGSGLSVEIGEDPDNKKATALSANMLKKMTELSQSRISVSHFITCTHAHRHAHAHTNPDDKTKPENPNA